MKIGFVLDDGLNKPDGVQQYIVMLGTYMRSRGHEVHYLVGETQRDDIPNLHSMAKNIRVHFNGNSLTVPLPASGRSITALLEQEQFDVLHVQTPHSPFMGAKVVRRATPGTAIVGTFHILPFGVLAYIGTWLLGLVLWNNLRRFDGFMSVSQPAAHFAKQTFGITSAIIPNAVSIKSFGPSKKVTVKKGPGLRIVFVGRLVERKGCRQLINALVLLHESGRLDRSVRLELCGDGPLMAKLQAMVAEAGLAQQVTFHGFVSEARKIAILQQADIAVFPALAGESFGIVLLEAMAAGRPVVLGGNNPGYQSVLAATPEAVVDASKPDVLAEQLHSFLISPKKRERLYTQQQKLVQRFDIEVVGKKVEQFYRTCKKTRSQR